MSWIVNVFWNAKWHRLRALWRLLLQPILWFVALLLISYVLTTITIAVIVATGDIRLEDVTLAAYPEILGRYPGIWWIVSTISEVLGCAVSFWLAGRFLDRRKFVEFGFRLSRSWWIDFGFGLILGAILMTIIFGVEMAAGWVTITSTFVVPPGDSFGTSIVEWMLGFVLVGFSEELFSRGYQLQNIAEGLNWKRLGPRGAIVIATLLSSAIFGVLHLGNPNANAISTFNIFLAGIMLAMGYILTGDLAIPIGLHITWNFFEGNVFGFPVSGGSADTTFIAILQSGPTLWTGGAFGPEAGLVGIGAMVLGIVLTVLWVYMRRGKVALYLPLAQTPVLHSEIVSTIGDEVEGNNDS